MDPLLAQIRDLLEQYLAQGEGTPVAVEAQALADAIGSAEGMDEGGAGEGLPMPPEGMPEMPQGLPEMPGPSPLSASDQLGQEMTPPSEPRSLREGSDMALEEFKKRKTKGY